MAGYLLDTHAIIWWLQNDPQLSDKARTVLSSTETDIAFSAASAWEIATKIRLGKLPLPQSVNRELPEIVRENNWISLSISVEAARLAGSFGHAHRDPFDRVLAAQSQLESRILVTCDRAFKAFRVRTLW